MQYQCYYNKTKKRKRDAQPTESLEHKQEQSTKKVKIKVEGMNKQLHEVQEELEDSQETSGFLLLSENKKMTEIDQLKREIQQMQQRIEELEKTQ